MKPMYNSLKKNHYSSNELSSNYKSAKLLFEEIGYDLNDLLKQNPNYEKTCAIRMSLALLKCGVPFSGRLKIKAGDLTGSTLEPGAKLLADQLNRATLFGKPIFVDPVDLPTKIAGQKGVIFFWKIFGYGGGHIDLIESSNASPICHSACYQLCKEIWFWPLH